MKSSGNFLVDLALDSVQSFEHTVWLEHHLNQRLDWNDGQIDVLNKFLELFEGSAVILGVAQMLVINDVLEEESIVVEPVVKGYHQIVFVGDVHVFILYYHYQLFILQHAYFGICRYVIKEAADILQDHLVNGSQTDSDVNAHAFK